MLRGITTWKTVQNSQAYNSRQYAEHKSKRIMIICTYTIHCSANLAGADLFHGQMARCTNGQPDNIIKAITTRTFFQLETEADESMAAFLKDQRKISAISEAAGHLSSREYTVLPKSFMENVSLIIQ